MFKKIILSLILLSNVIFAKNDIDEFGQLVDEEGYVKPENYMDIFRYKYYKEELPDEDIFRYWKKRERSEIDRSKYRDNLRQLNEWKKKWQDAGFGNQWAIDSEGYVDPKTYKYPQNNENFVNENPEIYWEQACAEEKWGDELRKAGYGNQWDEDSEGYINPKVYEDPLKNLSFYESDKDRYWDQHFELIRWGKAWEEKTPKNETSFFGKIKNFFKK